MEQLATAQEAIVAIDQIQERLITSQRNAAEFHDRQAEVHQKMLGDAQGTAQVMEEAAGVYADTAGKLSQTLVDIQEIVGFVRGDLGELKDSMETTSAGLGVAVDQLNARLAAEGDLLEGYREAGGQVTEALAGAGPVLEAMGELTEKLARQGEQMEGITTQISESVGPLRDVSLALHSAFDQGSAALSQAAIDMNQVNDRTGDWINQTSAALNEFGENVTQALERSLQQYDSSLKAAVGSLSGGVDTMDAQVTRLNNALERALPPRGDGGTQA